MRIAVGREIAEGERRVALVPERVGPLVNGGHTVLIEQGAGAAAGFADTEYVDAGARIVAEPSSLTRGADLVLTVREPVERPDSGRDEADLPGEGTVLIGFLDPLAGGKGIRRLAERGVSAFAMELIPRITRAQSMDALSSQATVAGYKAVLLAADRIGRFFPLLMTAAGTVPPARVLVLGAGVAGLQAVATARRLGAVVEAFDIRPAVREQVESLGATFIGVGLDEGEDEGGYAREVSAESQRRERELLAEHVAAADVVITTAQVPGKPAPVLVTDGMVDAMRPGSVVVDLAAASGGNCEPSQADREVEVGGVLILGPTNLPARLPADASRMYARNVVALLEHLAPDGELRVDLEDEITAACCITHDGRIVNERVREALAVKVKT